MKVYERLRHYIESNGLKFNFVADKAGINPKRFYRIINGDAILTADEFEHICRQGLSIDPGYFFQEKFLKTKNKSA